MMREKKFIFILGPTATGKTDLAIELCQKLKAPLLNLDSIQMYRGLDIGSAKPTESELTGVEHHLFSIASYPELLDASQIFDRVMNIVSDSKHESFVFCGGSGFYLQSIEKGMFQIDSIDPSIRKSLQKRIDTEGGEALFEEWLAIDPEAARKTSAQDHYRIIRALEIYQAFGKTLSQLREGLERTKSGLASLGQVFKFEIEWEKDLLSRRISQRVEKMFEMGFLQEVRDLLQVCDENWKPMQSVGYKEVVEALKKGEELDLSELKELISLRTRQLAKKQRTWFKKQQDIACLSGHDSLDEQLKFVLSRVQSGENP